MAWLKIFIIVILANSLIGCNIPLEIAYKKDLYTKHVAKKIRMKNSKKIITKAISMEFDISNTEAMVLWENYRNSDAKSFYTYLVDINPFQKVDKIYYQLFLQVKARIKILKQETRIYEFKINLPQRN